MSYADCRTATDDNLPYMKNFSFLLLLIFFSSVPSLCCECGPPGPASAYVKEASVVFVGRVMFTDDDGSRQIIQQTLVRFEVEESFKGLKSDVHDVWIDPGSCTSCYAEYKVGERYLVFASGGDLLPKDTQAISRASGKCRSKPLPRSIDRQNPPKIYWAPECSGTRQIVKETEADVSREVDWLRNYRKKMEKAGT